jgi:hypothetical protein
VSPPDGPDPLFALSEAFSARRAYSVFDDVGGLVDGALEIGHLNRYGEFVYDTTLAMIADGADETSFGGYESFLPALRDTGGEVYSALSGHAMTPAYSDRVGDVFASVSIDFDLDADTVADFRLSYSALPDDGNCDGHVCSGFMAPVPVPPAAGLLLAGIMALGLFGRGRAALRSA